MGGACPSRAPPTPSVEGSRAPPPPLVGGWYRDGRNWVHVDVNVVITDGVGGGLRGSGTMPAADVMVVHFDHLPHRHVQGHIQPNGDIKWANGKAWLKYEGEWQDHGGSASGSAPHLPISPGSASESMSPKLVNESLIVAAPAELAPQEPQANLAAWDDDVVDTPHARACEALKAVKIGQVRPEADGSAVVSASQRAVYEPGSASEHDQYHCGSASSSAAHSGWPEFPGSASESLSPGPASESLVVAAPTELAPPGPHARPCPRRRSSWPPRRCSGDDDVVDTPHARAVEALKAVKIGERRPQGDGIAAVSASQRARLSANEARFSKHEPGSASFASVRT